MLLPHQVRSHSLPNAPPDGAWFYDDGVVQRVGAKFQSPRKALASIVIALLLLGLAVSMARGFLSMATSRQSGTQTNLFVMLVPARMALLLAIAAILVFWFGLSQAWKAAVLIAGKTEVTLSEHRVSVFAGIWQLGSRRTFNAALVNQVLLQPHVPKSGPPSKHTSISLVGQGAVHFGDNLGDEHKLFIAETLSRLLAKSPVAVPPSIT